MIFKNLINKRYDKLMVIKISYKSKSGHTYWLCKCDCGEEKIIGGHKLAEGTIKSCGCYRKEYMRNKKLTHNGSRSKLYQTYKHMMERCFIEKNQAYENYGARGITVCDEWNYFLIGYEKAFLNFKDWALKSGYNNNLTIERIDNNDNYKSDNCKWATKIEQANNKRSTRKMIAFTENKSVAEWSRDPRCMVKYPTLIYRINNGWNPELALTKPLMVNKYK